MPWSVGIAAALQVATGLTFAVMGVVALRHGDAAQRAAERAVSAQGFTSDVLQQVGFNFRESAAAATLPLGIAAVLAALGGLNAAGSVPARTATFVLQPLLFVVGSLVTSAQVFASRQLHTALSRLPHGGDVDSSRVVESAVAEFPPWFSPLVIARFLLVSIGSIAVILLLAIPSSSSYF